VFLEGEEVRTWSWREKRSEERLDKDEGEKKEKRKRRASVLRTFKVCFGLYISGNTLPV
jgi:hypothetical protein